MPRPVRPALSTRASFRRLILAASLGVLLAGTPRPGAAQSLIDALSSAYETNPDLLGARSALRAVNEGVPQALGGWRPTVEFTGSAGYSREAYTEPPLPRVVEHLYPRESELAVTQPLFDAATASSVAGAEALVRAQRADLASTEQQVLLDAAQAYLDVAANLQILQLRHETEKALGDQISSIEQRLQIHEATRADLDQARSRLAGARADTADALSQLNQSRKSFRLVTGLEAGTLPLPASLAGLPASRDEAIAQARRANPGVIAAGFREQAARDDIEKALGALYPSLDLAGSVAQNYDTLSKDSSETTATLGLSVTVPLYQQGVVYSEVRQAKQTASQRRLATEKARRTAEQSAEDAWQTLVAARTRLTAYQEQVKAAAQALSGVRREYRLGDKTISDLLDQLLELKNAQIGAVGAARDEVLADFQLLSAVGRLNAGELGLPVEVYDPDLDYQKVRNAWFGLDAPGAE
ncbi:outer membrane protein/outer membrane protein, adhesin transport system [Tistlia consotensis]|uniref:Outer membrane protein/outer membrane protein, adhesin transport system n=1 Tax=Tistlia consotensis USBA 355 TaxID=560819 RepID=A0A1Y6BH92_9PROT|nr:TolC family outer membrane protein [Tistlia consotensis]SMF03864.1 outer membrane protein/outer membrane protein, adhesin transport system [Tistlia consotensis USBA 355]SNR54116.1 outer membrane protein/outer membrane protein, adhesin transport system [Tistlia consotensis]